MRMTREQFERARELDKEIQKYADLIGRIRLGVAVKKNEDEKAEKELKRGNHNPHNEEWTFSRFFTLRLKEQKVVALPHYEFAQGIEMDADAELIKVIINYLEEKKKECEVEFEQIGGEKDERNTKS